MLMTRISEARNDHPILILPTNFNNMINPYSNRSKTNAGIKFAESLMRGVATVTTSVGAFIWGKATAAQYLPDTWAASPWLAVLLGIAAACVSAWLTDLMFGDLLQRVTYDTLASRHPNVVKWQGPNYFKSLRSAQKGFFVVVLLILFAFDAYTTFIIRDPVADQARRQPTINVDSLRAKMQADHDAQIAALRADAKEKERAIAATEKRVEAGNPALSSLKAKGNAWAAQKIAASQRKATATDAKGRAAIEESIARARAEAPAYMQARIAEAEAANARATAGTDRQRAVFSNMYMAFTVIPKVLSIILRVLMVVSFLAYSERFNPDLTGDGEINYLDVEEYHRREKEAWAQRQAAYNAQTSGGPAFPPAHQ